MKTWTTKDGAKIPLEKLEYSHLMNIKSFIEQKSENGIQIFESDGDHWEIYDGEAQEYLGYKYIVEEIKKRKIK